MRPLVAALLCLLLAVPALAQPAHQVVDINTTQEEVTDPIFTSQDFAVLGTTVLFIQDDSVHGVELWKTDGTAAGTALVKDICPGACWGWPRNLTVSGGVLYFTADDGVHGSEPWRSDGTAAGTVMVADLNPGVPDSQPRFLEAGSILYLSANDGVHGRELWKTDGTTAGTQLVADIEPGPVGSDPGLWLDAGGKLLLTADDGAHGREPWLSDGTAAGTVLLADVNPGLGDSTLLFPTGTLENNATVLGGGRFLFTADDGVHGNEPWVSDGTTAGTALFADLNTGSEGSYARDFTWLGSELLFAAFQETTGTELWVTDGTVGGTALLKDINPGTAYGIPEQLTVIGGRAFFFAYDVDTGYELWKTDGTAAGTVQVTDINPGPASGISFFVRPVIQPFNGGMLFFADDGTHGAELWTSDGTAAGTALVKDLLPGTGWGIGRGYSGITVLGGTAFFRGVTLDHGSELWKTDGTAGGTAEVKDVQTVTSSLPFINTYPFGVFHNLGGRLLCSANDGLSGIEPWVSDGTAAGTVELADVAPGAASSYLYGIASVGGTALLGAGTGLWITDGTPAGTSPLAGSPQVVGDLVPALGEVFFPGLDDVAGTELWKSDGTAAGTQRVADLYPGSNGSYPDQLTPFGSRLLFTAFDGSTYGALWSTDGTSAGTRALTSSPNGYVGGILPLGTVALFTTGGGLWSTDGTPGGTSLLKDLPPGTGSFDPQELVRLGAVALFTAFDSTHGRELWASDGTTAGTVLLADLQPGPSSSLGTYPEGLLMSSAGGPAVTVGTLFFVADDGAHGRELWKTDGTAAGTALVRDINPGAAPSDPTELTVAAGRLFFVADDGPHGRELWVSDGTAAGTHMVLDILPGAGSSAVQQLQALGSLVLFSADDGVHGRELWRSDGVAVGTFLVQDIAPGPAPSSPLDFAAVGSNVFFAANDGVTGFEPWVIPQASVLATYRDVPGDYFAWRFIEALTLRGVTSGCGNGNFCPGAPITRAEMAVLLFTARGTMPPAGLGDRFNDVPLGYWAGPWIEELAREGVVSGCSANPPLYCPESPLTRAEMAVFLTLARHENPPPATGTRFADVPADYWAARFIEQLAADGVTSGCGGGNYCPGQPITRGEMAVFLATAFHLPLP